MTSKETYIKKIEYKQDNINYFKAGLSALISYIIAVIFIARNVFDWYLITLSTFVFSLVFVWFYHFFIKDKKVYFVREGDKNETNKVRKGMAQPKDIKKEVRIKKQKRR